MDKDGLVTVGIIIAGIMLDAALIFGIIWVSGHGFCFRGKSQHELHFVGKVINSTTGEWPNDRLVLLFLKGQEIARTTTALGEFKKGQVDIHDGFFDLGTPNQYNLGKDSLETLGLERKGCTWWTYFEVEEGDSLEFPIPEKNIVYVLKVIVGDISTLPRPMLEPGSIHLTKPGGMVVHLGPEAQGAESAHILIQAVNVRSQTEELEVNKITVPLNNCGGSALLEQEYIQTQTFIHEYSMEVGGSMGAGVHLPVLPVSLIAELEGKYGFTNGEISSRSISYRMKAEPGTNQVYVISWKEVWEEGEADMLVNNQLITVPFKVKSNLIYQVDSEALDCP